MAQIGPYIYDPANLIEKTFEGGRSFKVLISSAYDAGIIGPEHNGIVVLDNDNRQVVLDHLLSSGFNGSSEYQLKALEMIKHMDWVTFSKMCRDAPRFRPGGAEDLATGTGPDMPDPLNKAIADGKPAGRPGTSILTEEMLGMNNTKSCPYKFDLSTREDIIVHLAGHCGYSYNDNGHDFVLSWNIKVHGQLDTSGRCFGEEKVNPKYDAKWQKVLDADEEGRMFWRACENELSQYLEKEFTTYPGDDQGNYEFSVRGRSSGHLILTHFAGMPNQPQHGKYGDMRFENHSDFVEWLKDLPEEKLAALYKLVVTVDKDAANPARLISGQFSVMRQDAEERWDDEKLLRASKKAAKAAAMTMG